MRSNLRHDRRVQSPGIPSALLLDQNFRSILEIPGRQCPGDIVLSNQAKSKSVASGAVFLGVNLQVTPEMVRQGILAGYLCGRPMREVFFRLFRSVFRMENSTKPRPGSSIRYDEIIKAEIVRLSETGNEDPLPMLRNEALCINYPTVDLVAQLVFECAANHPEGAPLVVAEKILHVLKQERLWPMMFNYSSNIEEQSALRVTMKSMTVAQRILLRHPCKREWLTGEPRQHHIVDRYGVRRDCPNIAGNFVVADVVGQISLHTVLVPLRGKNTLSTNFLEASPETSDPCEKINEAEISFRFRPIQRSSMEVQQGRFSRCPLPGFPAIDRSFTVTEGFRRLWNGQARSLPQSGELRHDLPSSCTGKYFDTVAEEHQANNICM